MDEHAIDVLPAEVLGWVRADAARRTPRLWVRATKEYQVVTDYDRAAAGIGEGEDELVPVMVTGRLEISPQGGRGGWTLEMRAEDSVGLRSSEVDETYENEDDLTVEAFESQFLVPERGEVDIVVRTEDAAAWRRFRRWMQRRRRGPAF